MDIKKFKLLGEGFTGIEIEGTDIKHKENTDVLVDLKMSYKIPVPGELVTLLQGLKYYFLTITNLIPQQAEEFFDHQYNLPKMLDWSKSFDKSIYAHSNMLMQNTFITGFRYDGNGVLITAKMKGMEDLTFAINTPLIVFDQVRVGFEDDLERLVRDIKKEITTFVEDVKFRKMPARQFMMDLFKNDEEKLQNVTGMSDEELETLQVEKLKEKGFIVFKGEEVMEEMREIDNTVSRQETPKEEEEYFHPGTYPQEQPVITKEEVAYVLGKTEDEVKKEKEREWVFPETSAPVPLPKRGKMVPVKEQIV